MSTPTYSPGVSLLHAPETILRQMLTERLVILLGDLDLQRLLVRRLDTLEQGTQTQWETDCLAWFGSLRDRLRVLAGPPHDEGQLPAISVILASGGEDAQVQVAGGLWRRTSELRGTLDADDPTSSMVIDHLEYAEGRMADIQVTSWSTGAEEASLLHTVAWWALSTGKEHLSTMGLTRMDLTESGFVPSESPLAPHVPFVPMVNARLNFMYRTREVTGPQKHRVSLSPSSFTLPSF